MRRSMPLLVALTLAGSAPPAGAGHEPLAPEMQQAATVALHGIVGAGLFDPLGDYYSYEAVTQDGEGVWIVSFVANRCYRNEDVETCDPYQGRSDHVSPDAWVDVAQQGDTLRIVAARGRFAAEDRGELVGYDEPATPQPATLSFPTARLDPPLRDGEGWTIRAAALWSGVIPSDDRTWEVCVLEIVDSAGDVTWTAPYRVAMGTRGEDSRAGAFLLVGAPDPGHGVDARFTCEPFSGETWRALAAASVTRQGRRVYVSARLEWVPSFVAVGLDSRCDVTLRDRRGDVVKTVEKKGPLGSWVARTTFRTRVWTPRARSVASADVFCHEA